MAEFSNQMSAALGALSKTYYKVLKVNLTSDSFKVIKVLDYEIEDGGVDSASKFSQWIERFASEGSILEEDVSAYLARTDLNFLRNHFRTSDTRFSIRYRRKQAEGYRWVLMEILKADDYTDENQEVWLYVQDIHDSYVREIETQRELEYYCNFDTLTGLHNYHSYENLCTLYDSGPRHPVGVIFADMNGLKLTNDTRGHEAGNEYLKNFTKKLLCNFSIKNLYRISGDEFLVIMENVTKEFLENSAETFRLFLAADPVPQASLGAYWQEAPSTMAEVTKVAEALMYDSKQQFYEKHPEYRRGIAEINYKREISAVVACLSEAYEVMGTVDLRNDSYWILKSYESSDQIIRENSYTKFIEILKERVAPEFRSVFGMVGTLKHIKKMLRKKGSISYSYQMVSGEWLQLTIRTLEKFDGEPVKAIFLVNRLDESLADTLMENKTLQMEHDILDCLGKSYSMICLVDLPEQTINLYKNYILPKDLEAILNSADYATAVDWFCKAYVEQEDRVHFMEQADLPYVLERLDRCGVVNFNFRSVPEFHHTSRSSVSEFFYFALKSNPNKIVVATRNAGLSNL